MLERDFSDSDVFQQVTLATRYAADLLAQFPGTQTMPEPPPYTRKKSPADVLVRLFQCYKQLETIAYHSKVKVLHLDMKEAQSAIEHREVHPSDVYDMATLLVSDLAYFHSKLEKESAPDTVPYPGRKFPSHVYQEAGVLLTQLTMLEQKVKADPAWLNH